MKIKRHIPHLVLMLALCVSTAFAGNRIQYFVGYGIYPPSTHFPGDTTNTTAGTGLLAVNGSHRALIQLISAGPNNWNDGIGNQESNGYVAGDDIVLNSRILEVGVDGIDEWGYTHSLPPPYVPTNSEPCFVFVRIHQGATPSIGHWYHDTLLVPQAVPDPTVTAQDTFAAIIQVETSSEAIPTQGVALNEFYGGIADEGWHPDPASDPEIQYIEFNPGATGFEFGIPYSYSLLAVYGADAVLPAGGWDWQTLVEGTHYTVDEGVVKIVTTGEGIPDLQIIRLGLHNDF